MNRTFPSTVHDDNVIEVIKRAAFKVDHKHAEKYIQKFKRLMKKPIREREEIIETIEYYINNDYVQINLNAPLELMGEKELVDLLERIIFVTKKLI